MKKQFVIINKGKGVLKITPSNLNKVEQPLTEIEALYDYVNNQDGEVLLNSKAYTDNQITIVDDAITILGNSISTVNQNLTTKIEQLDDSVDTRIALLDEAVDTRLSSLNENLITKIDDAVYDITEVVLPLKENKNEKGIANGYVPLNEFTKIALQYLNVVNNLVDGGTDALLTAEQGKQLQLQVSAIQNILFSDNVNLDTVQEIVDALENVQSYIDTILVNDLTTGGITKALTAEMGKVLKTAIDDIYQPDVLISSVAPARVGNTFTYPAGQYTYLINKVLRTLLANYIVTIDATVSTNLKRVDLIQAHADGTFSKKIGTENAIIAVRPEVDVNCVPVSFINVFGNTIEEPTPITKELSIQDYNGVEKFRITDYLRFKGVSFDASAKALVTDPLMPLAAFLDIINGDDSIASIGNSAKSFKTMSALINALPVHTGETFTIYIDGGIIPITRKMPTRNLTFVANKATTLDFTNCMEDNGVTNAMAVLKNVSSFLTRVWTFNGSNISIICDYVGVKYFGVISEYSLIALKGNIDVLNWKSRNEVSYRGFIIENGTDLKINTCFNSTQDTVLFSGLSTDNTIHIVNYKIVSANLLNYKGNLIIDNITKVGSTIFNATLGYSITKKIGNVQFDDGTLIIGATDICQFNGKITGTCIVDLLNIKIIEGTLTSETYCTDQYLHSNILYRNFTGKLTNLLVVGTGKVTFENCTINVKNNLIRKYSSGAGNSGSGSSTISDIVTFRGSNTIIQDSTTGEPLFVSSANAFSPRILISEYGSTKTNVNYFGDYVDIVTLASTFKEKRKEIVVRSKKDLIGRILSSSTTYIIDGQITLLSGEYIEIPVGGLTIVGYGFDVSQINKNVAGQSIFVSPVGGSGNFVTKDMQYTSGLGSVFDIQDSSGGHAIEINDVNFIGCASIGKLKGYRQFTGTTCGIYSCKDGIQISGNWSGFKLTNSNIINFIAGGTLIKKDVDTLFSNRLYLDINFSCQTGAKLSDFDATNFASDELFQINNTLAALNGSKDATINTLLLLPNITPSNSKARFTNNLGITNSAMKFQDLKSPNGTVWRLTVSDTGVTTMTSI